MLRIATYFQGAVEIRLSRIHYRGRENRISRRMVRCTRKFGRRRIRERPKAGRLSNRRSVDNRKMYDFRKTPLIQGKEGCVTRGERGRSSSRVLFSV